MDNTDNKEKIEALAADIIKLSRNSLAVNLRFLDMAISMLKPTQMPAELAGLIGNTIAVNGERIYYDPVYILKRYAFAKNIVTRYYLHMVLHCVFSHAFVSTLIDRRYWDLACDIAVESIICELNLGCTEAAVQLEQKAEIDKLRKEVNMLTAEKLYRYFLDGNVPDKRIEWLSKCFSADDHSVWYVRAAELTFSDGDGDPSEKNKGGKRKSGKGNKFESGGDNGMQGMSAEAMKSLWKDVSERMQTDLETFGKQQGDKAGSLMQNLSEINREKYDYAAFLKKFAVLGEAMKINDDEFDYIFYTYGLEMYDIMPLIEPLEYKDVKRIREFVIAIDTSGSVSGELVQKFVQKTYNILKSEESFFRKINLHIIQCDAEIQEDIRITNQQEFDEYIEHMTLRGFGGTDFRPVFGYVDELIKNREFVNLKGLIYFTDGFGEFPERQPDYNTAFVFVDDDYNNPDVPVWAIKLILKSDEI